MPVYAELFAHLAAGGLVVLPNARAARTLRSAFDRFNAEQARRNLGPSAWEPARALSWQQFTTGLFNDLVLSGRESRLLLNEAQEHHLWRETITAAQSEPPQYEFKPDLLASSDSLAELARSAFSLASAYNAAARLTATANTQDTRTFAAWAADFATRCARSQLLSLAQLDSALLTHLQRNSLPAPAQLHIAAFDDPTPSQSALLGALRAHSTIIINHEFGCPGSLAVGDPGSQDAQPAEPLRASVVAPTERDEFILAACWIRNFLSQHHSLEQNHSPEQNQSEIKSIAVLVPSLDDHRTQLDLIFREILAPELQSIRADLSSAPWEFSSGLPLASLPLLHGLLELAHWAHAPLSLDRISALLLSPFFGLASDRNLAAYFDVAVLRRSTLLRPELDLNAFLALAAAKSHVAPLPAWLRNFQLQVTRAGNLQSTRTFAAWTEFLRTLATAAGWPGERPLTPAEFEATRAWDSVLDLLSTLDYAGRRVPLSTFLESLDRQARVTHFAGPSTHAPVQVMQVEDAAGSAFDAVLFLRATDANWPRSPRPNPLLSWHMQQQLNMPGASSAASTQQARRFTTHLLSRSAATLFFSAAENQDGHLRPTSLLAELGIPAIAPGDLVSAPPSAHPFPVEAFPDAAPIPAPPTQTRGGSKVLQLQAACGFLAFAELRLHSSELSPRSPGFDPLESGSFLHKVMQQFWESVQTQQNLRNQSLPERHRLLAECIDAAFAAQPHAANWDSAYLALQKQRLHTVLNRWLEFELQRSPFTVTATEKKTAIDVGPLALSIRVDRIDQVELPDRKQGLVLVDYKSSYAAGPGSWEPPRPDDPQLPLYALTAAPGQLHALAFAKIRAGSQAAWLGYQSAPGLLPIKTVSDLPQKIDAWRDTLTSLANAFYSGDASVSPKDFAQNCKGCAQRLVCRLDLEDLNINPDDEDSGDSSDFSDFIGATDE